MDEQTRWNKNIYQVPGLEFHENFGSKSGMSEHRFLLHAFSTMCFVHYSLRNLPGNFSNKSTNVFETDKKVVADLLDSLKTTTWAESDFDVNSY